jgi:prolyl-tRNA synthetase
MLRVYQEFCEEVLALPVIAGEKPAHERFPGAESSLCIEAMMQDGKALQAGTSHYLGQNFAKGSDIKFTNEAGEIQHAFTTSWGVSTRLIGGVIMAHSDDDGLRLPPRVAPKHVVILPVTPKPESEAAVFAFCEEVAAMLRRASFAGEPIAVHIDRRDLRGGEKMWQWVKKGIPLRIEIGPRDVEKRSVVVTRRDKPHKEKHFVGVDALVAAVQEHLVDMQRNYFEQAKAFQEQKTRRDIESFEELQAFFTPKNQDKPEIHGGFVFAKWCGDASSVERLDKLKVTVRCIPREQSGTAGVCILTGKPATLDAVFAKSY